MGLPPPYEFNEEEENMVKEFIKSVNAGSKMFDGMEEFAKINKKFAKGLSERKIKVFLEF